MDNIESKQTECASEGSLERVVRPLSGLQHICKLYGRMKCGATMMVWDYANECAVKESEMPAGSKRWAMSEKAKWSNTDYPERISG